MYLTFFGHPWKFGQEILNRKTCSILYENSNVLLPEINVIMKIPPVNLRYYENNDTYVLWAIWYSTYLVTQFIVYQMQK